MKGSKFRTCSIQYKSTFPLNPDWSLKSVRNIPKISVPHPRSFYLCQSGNSTLLIKHNEGTRIFLTVWFIIYQQLSVIVSWGKLSLTNPGHFTFKNTGIDPTNDSISVKMLDLWIYCLCSLIVSLQQSQSFTQSLSVLSVKNALKHLDVK